MTNDRPRVLQLIDHMGSGGAQAIAYDLARKLPQRDVDVELAHLFSANVYGQRLREAGCPVHDLSTGASYSPLNALDPRPIHRLSRLLKQGSYSIVNAHLYIAPLHLRAALGGLDRPPKIVNTVHAHAEHLPAYVYPSYRLTSRGTDMFVADFAASVAALERIARNDSNVSFIPFGIEAMPSAPQQSGAQLRAKFGVHADETVLLSVARLHAQRCIDRFIAAAAVVNLKDRNAHLVIVGDGPLEDDLRRQVNHLGMTDRIHFAGRQDNVGEWFAMADIFLSMSVGGDVGIAALQAAATGLPVLAWDILGHSILTEELDQLHPALTARGTGFVNALGCLLDDAEMRADVGRHGQHVTCTRFTVERMTDSYAGLYRSIAAA